MNHLMRYNGFSANERQDEILDKISKYGILSLTKHDKEFLDSYSKYKEEETHQKLQFKETENIFEDDNRIFKFEFDYCENYKTEKHFVGVMYVPDMKLKNGILVNGRLEGRIIYYGEGKTAPDFFTIIKVNGQDMIYDIFEFCNGMEYELDVFIDYIASELQKNKT